MKPDDIKPYLATTQTVTIAPKRATGSQSSHGKQRFNKALLPTPYNFYQRFNITIKSGVTWQMFKCVFHDDKHASMSINSHHGGFICHACGAKGDMVKFYMMYFNVDFKTACTELGLNEVDR